ncbi:hypothetical protein J7363_04805 [Phaeobacter italicus]|uniref:hypothetical protein n=1 Tax=Phaeobacter italicus TaxID=481446 RepID=UPI001ADCBF3C|nr:hypothetical protein [Phaeobacter italicus]MBO9441401.1 hypothetical protein [Phaeobacter italicus]
MTKEIEELKARIATLEETIENINLWIAVLAKQDASILQGLMFKTSKQIQEEVDSKLFTDGTFERECEKIFTIAKMMNEYQIEKLGEED